MSFSTTANKYFPDVQWMGGSDIHVSIAWNAAMPFDSQTQSKELLSLLEKQNVGLAIYRSLHKKFKDLVWIISPDEFNAIFLVDCYNHMHSKSDSRSPGKIKNPHTGNYFHRVAVIGDLVCGVRFWCDPYTEGETMLGFRFRIQGLDEAEDETRRRSRGEAIEAVEAMEQLETYMMDVAEPPQSKVKQVETAIQTLD